MELLYEVLGYYMLSEVSGFSQILGIELLYKTCGKTNTDRNGFQVRRYSTFLSLERRYSTFSSLEMCVRCMYFVAGQHPDRDL